MRQKLTRIIATPEMAISPIKTKREKLLHVWVANSKKAWRTRKKRLAALRAEAAKQDVGKEAA